MAVKDFMTKRVVYVSPETTVAAAADIMRDKGLRRLPVIEHDKLVGLITEGTMAEASPSKATSLSIYEMNYLLNKTKVGDIMIKNVLTVSKYASLEDAIYIMLQNKVGVLPVVDNDQISGIITDKDVFRAFLEISGYGQAGIRLGWKFQILHVFWKKLRTLSLVRISTSNVQLLRLKMTLYFVSNSKLKERLELIDSRRFL